MVAVGLLLVPLVAHHAPGVAVGVLWFAVALTLLTGAQYLWRGLASTREGTA
jgi:phosphatidylglycerophosphate synthase